MDLLNKIGRGAEKRLTAQGESWQALNAMWMKGRNGMKDSGLGVKDRRWVLCALCLPDLAGAVQSAWLGRLHPILYGFVG